MPAAADPALPTPSVDQAVLASRYPRVRATSQQLCAPLSPEDCSAQSMADASPAKWHLAHTTWFFETFVLERELADFRPFHPDFRVLFNSYYNGVGDQYPRPERGMLTRPSLEEVLDYRADVDAAMAALLERSTLAPHVSGAIELGLHHEQQHQELILTDLKHLLSRNPLHPAYVDAPPEPPGSDKPVEWYPFAEQLSWIGAAEGSFHFDNEGPRHREFIDAFELASRPSTNGDYVAFIEDGGYSRPELWLSDGWAAVRDLGWEAPLYWERGADADRSGRSGRDWMVMTLAGLRALRLDEPVCHLSYYEADAFARWMCARLPSEAEWEIAAADVPIEGNLLEGARLHPAPLPGAESSATTGGAAGPAQLFGDVWEWTQSDYSAYPGFRPLADTFGEYNGKFMCNQNVLRGGSCVTPADHIRASYRNFFTPNARWQFSGVRLARDIS